MKRSYAMQQRVKIFELVKHKDLPISVRIENWSDTVTFSRTFLVRFKQGIFAIHYPEQQPGGGGGLEGGWTVMPCCFLVYY